MGKTSWRTKLKRYHKIYEQVHANPIMSITDIAQNTGISRNTVAKYIKEMYKDHILVGPSLQVHPAPNYRQYIYLMEFTDPWKAFCGLRGFPHVVYHAVTFGDWNTLVITDRLLDVTQLVGFEKVVAQGVKYCSYTPKVELTTWDETFQEVYKKLSQFKARPEYKIREITPLTWQEDEWTLYHAFKSMRKPIVPLLQEISVSYEHYLKWMSDLYITCSVHTGFYPDGYESYLDYCFLFFTDYEESVKSVFSLFPTTPFFTSRVDNMNTIDTGLPPIHNHNMNNLSNKDLLTIILSSHKNTGVLVNMLLKAFHGNLKDLFTATVEDLLAIDGISLPDAYKIKAVFELGKRITSSWKGDRPLITSTDDVVLFRPAITHATASIILLHNHPSGDAEPSEADMLLTRELLMCSKVLDIPIIDHIIIAKTDVTSMKKGIYCSY